jgi:vacuolar-type H+-ATPase subunit H
MEGGGEKYTPELEMTWLSIKTIFKKVWYFFKTYWYIPLLVSWAIIAWLIFKNSGMNIADILHTAEESYRGQINVLNEAHEAEIKKRDEILKRYQETIEKLEEDRKQKNEELLNKEKRLIKELAEKYHSDPEAYAREIADKFGFEYVENE